MVLHEKRQDQVVPNAARGRDLTLMIIIYDSAKSKKPFAIHNHRHRIVLANSFMPNKDGVHNVSMSCTEGVTKRRYRVLCSWWSLVPDNNMIAKKCSHLRNTVKFCTAFHEELDAAAEY